MNYHNNTNYNMYGNNNRFSGNNFNNFGYSAEQILVTINNKVSDIITGRDRNVRAVRDLVQNLMNQNLIRMVGGGQNRIAIEFVPDPSNIMRTVGINTNIVAMIPIKLPEGINDNVREGMFWSRVVDDKANFNDPQMHLLRTIGLPSVMYPDTNILIQERVLRIEDHPFIKDVIRDPKSKYTQDTIGAACRDFIMSDKIYPQYVEFIKAMDKFFVIADMNPEFSPWNFGFKNVQGQERLTCLDYGYTYPRVKPLKCPVCGGELHYVIPGESFLKGEGNINAVRNKILTFGVYSCKNPNCGVKNNTYGIETGGKPWFEEDSKVFLQYIEE